jgi:hypothetical protein
VLNSRDLGAVSINDKNTTLGNSGATPAANVYDVANRQNSLDQYSYKPERGYQVTVKVRF